MSAETQPLTAEDGQPLSPWWLRAVLIVMVLGFTGLIAITMLAYHNAPPIPVRVVDAQGVAVFSGDDIRDGQAVFLKYGLMANGSIWGHGAYLGPDYSAEALHQMGEVTAEAIAQQHYQQPVAALTPSQQAAVQAETAVALKTNRYDAATETLRLTVPESAAYRQQIKYWPAHIALLPAIVLLFIPGSHAIELPWILWGSAGMGIDTVSRWWLAMSVVIWAASAAFLHAPGGHASCSRLTTLFLLTLAGQIGAILATDMVSYFTFMTLMGYAFVGLLVVDGNEQACRAGRIYLVLLVLADIALFEAFLIAAASTDDLGFAAIARAITLSPSSTLYLSMAIIGFALKAGFWPLHIWLPLAYGSARPPVALLLWVVPVATGLFGAVRWLPLGEIIAPIPGTLLQAIGAAGILYAMLFGLIRAQRKRLPAYIAIIATGMFAMGLGTGLVDPAVWNQYGDSAPVFVSVAGLGFAILIAGFAWLEKKRKSPSESRKADGAALWFERWPEAVIRWGRRTGIDTLPELRASWLARWGGLWQTRTWQKVFDAGEYFLQRWTFALMLFLLLGMVSVVLLLLEAMSVR